MKRLRGERREEREKLIKSIGEQIKSSLFIFGKSRFFDLAKGPCEGNLRKRFKLCLTHMAARFVAPDEDVNSDQCQLFNIFRAVFNIYTGKKCSEYRVVIRFKSRRQIVNKAECFYEWYARIACRIATCLLGGVRGHAPPENL